MRSYILWKYSEYPETRGYRVIRGSQSMRIPLLETVDSLNLTNMIIDVAVSNAYARGGIPYPSAVCQRRRISISPRPCIPDSPGSRKEIIRIAENPEENLRGVLSQLTPEEVNEDKLDSGNPLEEADQHFKLGWCWIHLRYKMYLMKEASLTQLVVSVQQRLSKLLPYLKQARQSNHQRV